MINEICLVLLFILIVLMAVIIFQYLHTRAGNDISRFFVGGVDLKIIEFDTAQHSSGVKELDVETFSDIEFTGDDSIDYSKYHGWVLIDQNGKVCGYCLYDKNEPLSIKAFGENTWYFANFAVSKEYSGKGYGSKLLQKLIDAADSTGTTLTTRAYKGQSYLIKLYSKYGFNLVPNSENKLGSPKMIRPPQK